MTAKTQSERNAKYIKGKQDAGFCSRSGCHEKAVGFYCPAHRKLHAEYQASLRAIKRASKALPTNEVKFGEAK